MSLQFNSEKNYDDMTTLKFISLSVVALSLVLVESPAAQDRDDAYRTEIFSTVSEPSVTVSTSGGFIEVHGHNSNEVRVDMVVRRGNRTLSPSDTDLDDFEITIRQDGNQIIASAERKGSGGGFFSWFGGGSNISVSFVVQAPESSVVEGRTSGGSVTATNFANNISLRTSGGSVTAESIRGIADLRTSGGSIRLTDVHGEVSAQTSGGSIRADGLTGPADLRTSGGSIRFENASGAISARTSGGSIRAQMNEFSENLDLRTSGGSIRIQLPQTDHFDVDLRGSRVDMTLNNFSGDSERNRVKGRIGDGGPVVAARTSGGTVSVEY